MGIVTLFSLKFLHIYATVITYNKEKKIMERSYHTIVKLEPLRQFDWKRKLLL